MCRRGLSCLSDSVNEAEKPANVLHVGFFTLNKGGSWVQITPAIVLTVVGRGGGEVRGLISKPRWCSGEGGGHRTGRSSCSSHFHPSPVYSQTPAVLTPRFSPLPKDPCSLSSASSDMSELLRGLEHTDGTVAIFWWGINPKHATSA